MNVRERSPSRPEAAAPAGDLAARYRSLFEIGRGGMGTIEVALELGATERIVALKRMHPESSRERRQVEMFLREARLAVLLVHPNVVHAFDFGETSGELFLAMEYVEGETLSAMVRVARERPDRLSFSPALAAAILADACEGLHAAHELRDPQTGAPLNVIHRDVSPHNVMVSYEGHVKLLDFGVAKMDLVDPLTRTGEVKGKTAYMSPEQAMGETLDRRSDLFSLGAVLFECVAGRRMYGGTDMEVLRKLALEAPPSLADAAPLAPPALVDLHARLVARQPDGRPENALAVAHELRAYVASSGVRADAAAIAEMMTALFAEAAAERKRRLNEALTKQVPAGRVEVLRRSLAGPTALAGLTQRMPPPAPLARPSVAPPTRSEVAVPPRASTAPRATRSGVIVSALMGLVLAAGIVAFTTSRSGTPPAPRVSTTATAPISAPPPPSATAPATASASATAPASASASAHRPSPRRPPKPSPSTHAVDVDTNPL